MVDLSPSLTMRDGKGSNVNRRRFHSEGARSLPNSPFVQRRIATPTKHDGHVLELPPLHIPTRQKGDHAPEESGEGTAFPSREKAPRSDHHNNEGDPLSSFVSPSLRRKVLRKRNGLIQQQHMLRDGDTSDESWASVSPRLLSPGTSGQESNVTLEMLFSNVENSSLGRASPATQRRVRPDNALSRIDLEHALTLGVGSVHSIPRSLTSSPRNSPCQSPGSSRRVVDSYNASRSHGPAISELTVENVKAFETIADEHPSWEKTPAGSSCHHDHDHDQRHSHHLYRHHTDNQQHHPDAGSSSSYNRHHPTTLITAKLTAGDLVGSPPCLCPKDAAPNPVGKHVDVIDLEAEGEAIQPPLAPKTDSDGEENSTMKRCQEWLANIQLAPKSET